MEVEMKELIIEKLLKSKEPSIRYKTRVKILNENPQTKTNQALSQEINHSDRVKKLLQRQNDLGEINNFKSVYDKWQGAHWILLSLVDLGYSNEDKSLNPIIKQVVRAWLAPRYFKAFEVKTKKDVYKYKGIPIMNGRYRVCASIQANALYTALKFGYINEYTDKLAERLMLWQWEDGGWNCDKNPDAKTSTFIHTFYSMRALYLYGKKLNNQEMIESAIKAKEFLLARKLFRRKTNNEK